MLKKTLTAAITAAVLLSAGAAMAATPDANWAFSKEAVEVLKNKNGYTIIKKIELENPATGIWKAEGVKKSTVWKSRLKRRLITPAKCFPRKKTDPRRLNRLERPALYLRAGPCRACFLRTKSLR